MQFHVGINQVKALEWELNAQQAILFAYLYEVPSWADPYLVGDQVFYNIAKTKIVKELPLLTDKPDTAYRLMKQLSKQGVIEMSSTGRMTLIRITAKGKQWNYERSEKYPTSEKYPSDLGKISGVKSEKSPTNHNTNNHITNINSKAGKSTRQQSIQESLTDRSWAN